MSRRKPRLMALIPLVLFATFSAACESLETTQPASRASRLESANSQIAAGTIPHKEKAAGTIHVSAPTSPGILHQTWTAAGNGTHIGRYTQSGSHDANLATGAILNGVFTSVAADGSTISGTYSGSFTLNADGSVNYLVTVLWLSGTGRLTGVTGSGPVSAIATGAAAGATFTYETDARFQLP